MQGADPSQQSPWEMFNEDVQPEEVLAEAPALESSLQLRASAALERLSRAPRFQLFHETPTPDAVFSTGDEGERFSGLPCSGTVVLQTLHVAGWNVHPPCCT